MGLEALAGRLNRRGGSTPPEGDFGAGGEVRGAIYGRGEAWLYGKRDFAEV